VTTELLEFAN